MKPLNKVIINKDTSFNPIWIMRQAGRYLPEFREIRKQNPDFIKLCLNEKLSSEITLQPLKRFDLDAAIIFSDILMLPYGLNQNVEFKKNIGPLLGNLDLEKISDVKETDFVEKLSPVYKLIELVSSSQHTKNKTTIGFVGAPWTLLVYMINKKSPKLSLNENFFEDKYLIDKILKILDKFLKIHIKNQIDNGAQIIQIFDSWAGLLKEKDLNLKFKEKVHFSNGKIPLRNILNKLLPQKLISKNNVMFIDQIPHSELPSYIKYFKIGLIHGHQVIDIRIFAYYNIYN